MRRLTVIAAVFGLLLSTTQPPLAQDGQGQTQRGIEKKDIQRGMVVAKPGSITPHSRHTVKRRGETPSLKHRH
jgi:elongation factor Tu